MNVERDVVHGAQDLAMGRAQRTLEHELLAKLHHLQQLSLGRGLRLGPVARQVLDVKVHLAPAVGHQREAIDAQIGPRHRCDKALGVFRNLKDDVFSFKLNIDKQSITKRVMLSIISSIYDPLGFAGPFILEGRRQLQSLCNQDFQWDDELSEDIQYRWHKWVSKLRNIENLSIRNPMTNSLSVTTPVNRNNNINNINTNTPIQNNLDIDLLK